ncbi:hypothetical protein D9619_000399 [Psilocybe cf. subviscida]|uniref:Uncharacterized protein n=1 Tax=Psilocybe cf. subviscida TaxID=2480587 RepID=A0A8H5F465_9AGAR|nr:hypothetical protein D9619_000399 [Psilocybe cf. subviscida]
MTDKPGIAISHDNLYVLQPNGAIFGYVERFNAWHQLDGNPETSKIAAGNDHLYQLHSPDNSIWTFSANTTPQWVNLDSNEDTKSIAAGGDHLYQIHSDGQIYAYDAENKKWDNIEKNTAAVKIVTDGDDLYQLHKEGAIYKYNGPSSGGWTGLDDNADTTDIVVGGGDVYQVHKGGAVWKYADGAWNMLDNNPNTLQIAAGKAGLYQRQKDRIYKYDGSQWDVVMDAEMTDIVVGDTALYVRNDAGVVLRYQDGEWFVLAPVANA